MTLKETEPVSVMKCTNRKNTRSSGLASCRPGQREFMIHPVVHCVGNSSFKWWGGGGKDLREKAVHSKAITRNHIIYSTRIRAPHLLSHKITLAQEPTAIFSIHFLLRASKIYSFLENHSMSFGKCLNRVTTTTIW